MPLTINSRLTGSIRCGKQVFRNSNSIKWMKSAALYERPVALTKIDCFRIYILAPAVCMSISKNEEETFNLNATAGVEQFFQSGRPSLD